MAYPKSSSQMFYVEELTDVSFIIKTISYYFASRVGGGLPFDFSVNCQEFVEDMCRRKSLTYNKTLTVQTIDDILALYKCGMRSK